MMPAAVGDVVTYEDACGRRYRLGVERVRAHEPRYTGTYVGSGLPGGCFSDGSFGSAVVMVERGAAKR